MAATPHQDLPSDPALQVKALESLLVEKGYVDPAALDALVDAYENKIGPHIGARIVAHAWADPDFKQRLLSDAKTALAELDITGWRSANVIAVENTPQVHNVVVCTLCSCYPWSVLGLPPAWYKAAPYRSRVVIDPRGVLSEFGIEPADDVEIRVWDSTAELRYIVIPERPPGSEALDEEALAQLVSRDSMIGTGRALSPDTAGEAGAP